MARASAGKRDMMNQPGHGGDVPVAKRRRCVEPAGAAAAGIPEDIVEEILLRLPVKSILRFRSVCKSWRAVVADPRFVRLQLDHSTTAARHRPPSMLILADWCVPEQRRGTIDFFSYPGHGVAADFALGMTWSSPVATAAEDDVADWDAVDDGDDDDNLDDAVDDGDAAADGDDAVDGNADDNGDINDGAIGLGGALHYNGLVLLSSMENSSIMLVCNPATKEIAELPACTPDYFRVQRVCFYADQPTGKTKVVHYFIRHCNETLTDYSRMRGFVPRLAGVEAARRPSLPRPEQSVTVHPRWHLLDRGPTVAAHRQLHHPWNATLRRVQRGVYQFPEPTVHGAAGYT
ncbi:Os06g0170750 [Oryza sativa Japonica Group]|uniref:Os06g0170750 protein n=2 Tax=Oryza sativa subsp. japonica TaxID=39947 RepID=Q5SNM7_ORYSJ|nr:hypothetical protein [Oryza sativa Japonica Group]BAS96375.1 Os06g0170750 [Oryza sativa Japonica Group]